MLEISQSSEFLAQVLRNGSRAFAAYAADDFLKMHPEAAVGLGSKSFSVWQERLAERVEELAAATAVEQPGMFASQIRWAGELLAARGVSTAHFRASLTALRIVLTGKLPQTVQPLAAQYLDEAIDSLDEQCTDFSVRILPDTPHGRLTLAYLVAVLEGDRVRASRLILDAVDQPESVRDIYLHVLMPAQVELGRMWQSGEINVADEHFGSYTTKTVMTQLLSLAHFQPPNGKAVLTAAVAGNHVDIGLHAVADFFEMAGWQTIRLGADVPARDLAESVESFDIDLLALSASLNIHLDAVKSTIQAVRSGNRGDAVKILVGGRAFAGSSEVAVQLGADGYAADPDGAVRVGCQLVGLTPDYIAA
jgi:methanogenic corrinoid protein MtbC1